MRRISLLHRCRASWLALLLVPLLTTGVVWLSIPTSRAFAYKEQTHGLAAMLSLEYLAHRAARPGAAQHDTDAYEAYVYWSTVAPERIDELLGSETARAVLNISPEALAKWQVAPNREEPGFSGYFEITEHAEFPQADGALLAYVTAMADENSDVWADARSPFQYVRDAFDLATRGGITDELLDRWTEWVFERAPGDTWHCASDGSFLGDVWKGTCVALELFVRAFIGLPLSLVVAFALAVLKAVAGDALDEEIVEDALSGCTETYWGGQVVDGLIEEYERENGPISESIKNALRNDSDFYADRGIDENACDEFEEGLEELREFRTYGTPKGDPQFVLTLRARFADAIRACDVDGADGSNDSTARDAEQCVRLRVAELRNHFRSVEPWALSAEGVKREPTGSESWERWRHDHFFTSMTHFLNVLTPERFGFFENLPAPDGVQLMRGSHGLHHAFDGYSVEKPFNPAPAVTANYPVEPADLDDSLRTTARDFRLRSAPETGYLLLRRRICESFLSGDEASLASDDGLGFSKCHLVNPELFSDKAVVEEIHAPAELGALDGWTRWVYGETPSSLAYTTPSGRARAYQYYDSFLPLLGKVQAYGQLVPPLLCDDPIRCENGPLHTSLLNAIALDTQATEAFRLRSLGVALHMLQDMTVPHHLAPTTGWGHAEYEQWFKDFVWPVRTNHRFQPITLSRNSEPSLSLVRTDIQPYWGLAGQMSTDDMYAAIVGAEAHNQHLLDVDQAYELLNSYMGSLAGTDPQCDRFAIRRLVRATAFRTAELLAEVGQASTVGTDLTTGERQYGFFLYSAVAAAETKLMAPVPDSAPDASVAVPAWPEFARRSFPLVVAAGARLLVEAARVRKEGVVPQTVTCDLPSEAGQSGALVADGGCAVTRTAVIRTCFRLGEDASGANCGEYAGIAAYDDCRGARGFDRFDQCATVASLLGACACAASPDGPLSIGHLSVVGSCLAEKMETDELVDLHASGQIDDETFLWLMGDTSYADRDGDGIPDTRDLCPSEGVGGNAYYSRTALNTGVCWLKSANLGLCRYGCLGR